MRRGTYEHIPPARRRLARSLGIALVVISAGTTGCNIVDPHATPRNVPENISGTYALADVGGNKVPASVYQGPFTVNGQKMDVRIDVVGSTMELDATRYWLRMQFLVAAQGQTVPLIVADSGTYSTTAGVVSFTSPEQKLGRLAGNIQNGDLKVSIDLAGDGYPPTYLFRK
jgi:hypothetical protein